MEKDQKVENLVTWFFMFAGFMSILAWGAATWDFEEKCELACVPGRAMTPLYKMEHTCFCETSRGKWEMKEP
jgi:hypothetical protein